MLYGIDDEDDDWGDTGRVSELRSAVLADAPPGAGTDDGNPADEYARPTLAVAHMAGVGGTACRSL